MSKIGSTWENSQYLCIKGVNYSPAQPSSGGTVTAPVIATVDFWGSQNKIDTLNSNAGARMSSAFYANGSREVDFTTASSSYNSYIL